MLDSRMRVAENSNVIVVTPKRFDMPAIKGAIVIGDDGMSC